MQIFNELTKIDNASIALGFFDGIHLGHRVVIKNAVNIAREKSTPSVVLMFKEHPLSILTDENVPLILTSDEKIEILKSMGVDDVVLLDFKEYSHLSAGDYLKNVLVKYFSPVAITTGFNHTFGFNREGDSNFLKNNSKEFGYRYYEIPPYVVNDMVVSSSSIKNCLVLGDFYSANKLLGYEYFVQGIVQKGDKIASKYGFASANIIYPPEKVQIPHGVYYVLVSVNGKLYNGVLNHGVSPTLNEGNKLKTEVHIIDFNYDIYGENIKISFVTKIRNQIKFDDIEKLKQQIQKDISFARVYQYFLFNSLHNSSQNMYF